MLLFLLSVQKLNLSVQVYSIITSSPAKHIASKLKKNQWGILFRETYPRCQNVIKLFNVLEINSNLENVLYGFRNGFVTASKVIW